MKNKEMKKKLALALVVAMVVALVVALGLTSLMATASTVSDEQTEPLYIKDGPAPRDMLDTDWLKRVGEVQVWNDGDNLYVKYVADAEPCWEITEIHLWVGEHFHYSDVYPKTKKGNPIPGQFPYKDEFDPPVMETPEYEIPMDGLFDNRPFISIMAQAVVRPCGGGAEVEETAWADCTRLPDAPNSDFPPRRWAKWFPYPRTAVYE